MMTTRTETTTGIIVMKKSREKKNNEENKLGETERKWRKIIKKGNIWELDKINTRRRWHSQWTCAVHPQTTSLAMKYRNVLWRSCQHQIESIQSDAGTRFYYQSRNHFSFCFWMNASFDLFSLQSNKLPSLAITVMFECNRSPISSLVPFIHSDAIRKRTKQSQLIIEMSTEKN